MSVLLTILKILGIILLVIIGLILLLLLAVLFLPVRYRIHGEYEEDFHLEAKAGWLCRLIYFHFKMDNKEKIGILRIFGIPIMQFPPNENKKHRKRKSKSKKKKRDKKKKEVQLEAHDLAQSEAHDLAHNEGQDLAHSEGQDKAQREETNTEYHQDEQSEFSQPLASQLSEDGQDEKISFIKRIQQFFDRVKQRLLQLPVKLKAVFSKIDDIKMLWMDENNKKSTGLILAEVKYLLLHYGLTKIHADVRYSTGDPATTGKILGGLSMIPFLYQKDVHITPDFESDELYLKGYLIGKGHIRMLHLIRTLLHFRKDKNIIKWIKDNL